MWDEVVCSQWTNTIANKFFDAGCGGAEYGDTLNTQNIFTSYRQTYKTSRPYEPPMLFPPYDFGRGRPKVLYVCKYPKKLDQAAFVASNRSSS